MRGKGCSAEFMRRIERMVQAHEGKHKDLVKFISHQTCISPVQITQLLRTVKLKEEIFVNKDFQEEPQPTILNGAMTIQL